MNYFHNLKKKLKKNDAKICIIGLGYVGTALLKKLQKNKINTIGIDKNKKKLQSSLNLRKTILTNNYKFIHQADVIIICLPTPLKKNMSPDLSYLENSFNKMKKYLKKGQLISLESTSYPGTTNKIFASYLKKKFKISENFFLVYSPERISPELKVKDKSIKYSIDNTPKIYSGFSENCKILGRILYRKITKKVVLASNLNIAETSKMIENIFRSVNIALVNELKMFLSKININIHEVLDLASTKPFGFTKFIPGPGYGGHCIPLDPYYLYWLAKKNNFNLKFIKTSGEINRIITIWIAKKIINFIKRNRIKLHKKKILLLGVAYKQNIDDIRESPAIKIANKLENAGYSFEYSDPYVKSMKFKNKIKRSVKLTRNIFKKFKVVVIVTNHNKFDYKLIKNSAKYLFDCRNSVTGREKNYFSI
tara:strand:+ start:606 stop:1871 length:1266 start_codon:yes stop_codon:yes gene_type:complete